VVSDLDGTLANNDWRADKFLSGQRQDWNGFHSRENLLQDRPYKAVISAFHQLQRPGTPDVIVSSRSFMDLVGTQEWLERWGVQYDHLFMRRAGDAREDSVVKREILRMMRDKFKLEPWIVLDDRDRVVRMWRDQGITCFQVRDGAF
jgi:hypothetical protein